MATMINYVANNRRPRYNEVLVYTSLKKAAVTMKRDRQEFNGKSYLWDGKYYVGNGGEKRMHVDVWEHSNGPVPKGYCVHHKDSNRRNNSIDNLEIMSNAEHARLHSNEPGRIEGSRERIKKAAEFAKIWHASQEGRDWHAIHGRNTWDGREKKEYKCRVCGKMFLSRKSCEEKVLQCSGACRTQYRQKSGLDNITAICKGCGIEFQTNKYNPRKYHSKECRYSLCRPK
jgi:hypothetical protein